MAVNTGSEVIEAGTSTVLKFHFTDANGEPFTDLLVHHARILHVLLVSENLQIVGHIHPEDFGHRNVMEERRGLSRSVIFEQDPYSKYKDQFLCFLFLNNKKERTLFVKKVPFGCMLFNYFNIY